MNLALFDFDGTITTKDSLADFIKFAIGKPKYFLGLLVLSPMLITYKLKFIKNSRAKEIFLAYFFKNWNVTKFQEFAEDYSKNEIHKIIRPLALEKILWHKEQGDRVVLVSASIECWLKAWSNEYNLELLSTRLETQNDHLTGRFSTPNCYGKEKVIRVKKILNIKDYDVIYTYGDSAGDKELLNLAHKKFYKPFR